MYSHISSSSKYYIQDYLNQVILNTLTLLSLKANFCLLPKKPRPDAILVLVDSTETKVILLPQESDSLSTIGCIIINLRTRDFTARKRMFLLVLISDKYKRFDKGLQKYFQPFLAFIYLW